MAVMMPIITVSSSCISRESMTATSRLRLNKSLTNCQLWSSIGWPLLAPPPPAIWMTKSDGAGAGAGLIDPQLSPQADPNAAPHAEAIYGPQGLAEVPAPWIVVPLTCATLALTAAPEYVSPAVAVAAEASCAACPAVRPDPDEYGTT